MSIAEPVFTSSFGMLQLCSITLLGWVVILTRLVYRVVDAALFFVEANKLISLLLRLRSLIGDILMAFLPDYVGPDRLFIAL